MENYMSRGYDSGGDLYSSRGYSSPRTTGAYRNNDFSDGLDYKENEKRDYKLAKKH